MTPKIEMDIHQNGEIIVSRGQYYAEVSPIQSGDSEGPVEIKYVERNYSHLLNNKLKNEFFRDNKHALSEIYWELKQINF